MKIYNRELKEIVEEVDTNAFSVKLLYNNVLGRIVVKALTKPAISKLNGKRYSKKSSARKIKKFVLKNNIDMNDYPEKEYKSFNDFFTRKKKNVNYDNKSDHFISPADSKILVIKLNKESTFYFLWSIYNLKNIVKEDLTSKYSEGYALIFRLEVSDYHRYHFIDDGTLDEYK